MNETVDNEKIIYESYDFFAALPFTIQVLAFVAILIIIIGFILWIYLKGIKPTIEANKFVKTIKEENRLLKNRIDEFEIFKKKILYSKIVDVDISFPSLEDKLLLNNIDNEILDPKSDIDYFLLGLVNMMHYKKFSSKDKQNEKKLTDAKDCLGKAIDKVIGSNHFQSEYYNYLGVVSAWSKNYDEAIDYYNSSIEINNKNYKSFYNLACSYSKKLKLNNNLITDEKNLVFKNIEQALKKALDLRPDDYIVASKDDDFDIIREETFFADIIQTAASKFHYCKSFKPENKNSIMESEV